MMATSFSGEQRDNNEPSSSSSSWPAWSWFFHGKQALLGEHNNNEEVSESNFFGSEKLHTDGYSSKLEISKATSIAACFLLDYEHGRPPSLSPNVKSITDLQLQLHGIKFSIAWEWLVFLASALIFVRNLESRLLTSLFHTYAIFVFLVDLYMKNQFFDKEWMERGNRTERHWIPALLCLLTILGIQSWSWIFLQIPETHFSILMTSAFKPIVFFYASRRARDALEALLKIGKILLRVVIIELFLILAFAAVACRLYYNDESFHNLSASWLSLFELSTTVVNPSIWMPMYAESRANAFFFVFFIITSIFYLHSLILSVVFQVFIQAASEVHCRSASDRDESIRLAFHSLSFKQMTRLDVVETKWIRETLQKARPHYNALKINVLMEILDPREKRKLDYSSFRTKIREALNVRIRTTRQNSFYESSVETLSVVVTAVNFVYVILTSQFQANWFDSYAFVVGALITSGVVVELVVRCNFMKMTYLPMTRLNAVFDILALIGAVVSLHGIYRYLVGHDNGIDHILTGRAIDLVRTMRFFPMFRDVVERSVNVLPALAGPVYLVLTTIHIFVCIGMALWGDAVDMDELSENEEIADLYYLNNFNSYTEGLVTIFNVMVVNDWHEVANVFLFADRFSNRWIVYSFFVLVIIIGVSIMLNVITAFFVETFVTRISKIDLQNEDVSAAQCRKDFSIQAARKNETPYLNLPLPWAQPFAVAENNIKNTHSSYSSGSSEMGEPIEFDVFEREGFDQIMETVGQTAQQGEIDKFARTMIDTLEIVGGITPGWDKIGFMVCCKESMSRFNNSRFYKICLEYISDENMLYGVIDEINRALFQAALRDSEKRILRPFFHPSDSSKVLEISALLLPRQQSISIIIARTKVTRSALPTALSVGLSASVSR